MSSKDAQQRKALAAQNAPSTDSALHAEYASATQAISKASAERREEELQQRREIWASEGVRQKRDQIWKQLLPAISCYLNGATSKTMVEGLVRLCEVSEANPTIDNLVALSRKQAWPTYENEQDQIDASVCLLVIGTLCELKTGRKRTDALIEELDGVTDRIFTGCIDFVRHVVEAGGVPDCAQCGQRLTPGGVERGRCNACINRSRETLSWLGIAIECQSRYGSQVYGDDITTHFPEWRDWRRRLRECFGREKTDSQLWENWIGFAQEYLGVTEDQFLLTLRSEANALLPTIPSLQTETATLIKQLSSVDADHSLRTAAKERDHSAAHTSDDALPKSLRASSPSRTLARAAYNYAMNNIQHANRMTANELFDALKRDKEAVAMLPPNAAAFRRYLNECGIRFKKGWPKDIGSSIVRQSEM